MVSTIFRTILYLFFMIKNIHNERKTILIYSLYWYDTSLKKLYTELFYKIHNLMPYSYLLLLKYYSKLLIRQSYECSLPRSHILMQCDYTNDVSCIQVILVLLRWLQLSRFQTIQLLSSFLRRSIDWITATTNQSYQNTKNYQ